jgi:glycosyltransferase involved in cell wall biosynthesis
MNAPEPSETTPCLAVVIPVYNEASTITQVVKTVFDQPLVQEVIIVDDASSDGSWDVLQPLARAEPRLRLFQHPLNQGKGAALRTGLAKAAIYAGPFWPAKPTWSSARDFSARERIVSFTSGTRWETAF